MDVTVRKVKETFETIADSWFNVRNKPFDFVRDFSKKIKNKRVLEVGCGCGAELALFAKENFVVGLDIAKKMIKYAKKYFEKNGFKGHFVVGNILELRFKQKSFDVCLCIATLHHSENRIKALNELKKVAKENILLSVWKKQKKFLKKLLKSFFFSLIKKCEYGDVLVPWNYKGKVIYRFYHLFSRKEFEKELKKVFENCETKEDNKGNLIAFIKLRK